ncbi:MAG: hypothetical protein K0S76_154 [Herbinix sp.]|nr:hypothetical protein [Herbinix sp.]
MITKSELLSIDKSYFTILQASSFAIYIKSNCTGHYFGLLVEEYRTFKHYRVYHKHHQHNEYHRHRDCKSIKVAVERIMSHDKFHLNGRRPVTI